MSYPVRFGRFELLPVERQLLADGHKVALGSRAFDLLEALVDRRGRLATKAELLERVWPGLVVEEANLAVQISALRKLLGADAIVTVPGLGYRFAASVSEDAAGTAADPRTAAELPLPSKPSIAVLPFVDLGGPQGHPFFIDGITEDVITELSRFKSLFVISRDSSFVYRGKPYDAGRIGRELGVRYLLEGSVRRQGSDVRVTGQLIESGTGNQLWSERYDRTIENVFAVQEDIAHAIVGAIEPQIEETELGKISQRRPGNLTVYEAALRAWSRAIAAGSTTDRMVGDDAIRQAREVLRIDPESRRALNALAWANGCQLYFRIAADPAHAFCEAEAAAVRAVELDRSDALSLALKAMTGLLAARTAEYLEIRGEARRAHELNPNDTFVLLILAHVEAFGGDYEDAFGRGKQILRLDPSTSRLALVYNIMAMACFGLRRYEDGVRWALRALHELPTLPLSYTTLVGCRVGLGDIESAKTVFARLRIVSPIYAQSRLDGVTAHWTEPSRSRQITFVRIAAGLEPPAAADALR